MILVDTSVWIYHLRHGEGHLKSLLQEAHVMTHDFILGELACGNLKNRKEILSLLRALPRASLVTHEEALHFIEKRALAGLGLGYIDLHLLSSAQLSEVPLWTFDKKLQSSAAKLGLSYR